jgi:hypothetical protein
VGIVHTGFVWRKVKLGGRYTEKLVHEKVCMRTSPGMAVRSCGSIMIFFLKKVLSQSVPGVKGCQQLASPRPLYSASNACLRGSQGCHVPSFQILEQSVGHVSL